MKLDEIRQRIDLIDAEINLLLMKRMELALKAGRCKQELEHPDRELQIIEGLKARSSALMPGSFMEALYGTIFRHSRTLQQGRLKLIGYQGEYGAFSEAAAHDFEPDGVAIPHKSFEEVFLNLLDGTLDYGIVPVRNSTTGRIDEPASLVQKHGLPVLREITLSVQHCLLALPGVELGEIRTVYSHPQALAQCRRFLSERGIESAPYYDTAGAALMLSRERPKHAAAVAARRCAQLYGLSILAEGIQDDSSNATCFAVVSGQGAGVS